MTQHLINLIAFAPLVSLVCVAVHACIAWEGMILHFVHRWWHAACATAYFLLCRNTPEHRIEAIATTISKPLYACLICMSSVWTIVAWLAMYGAPNLYTVLLILWVCGINTILDSLIYKLRS